MVKLPTFQCVFGAVKGTSKILWLSSDSEGLNRTIASKSYLTSILNMKLQPTGCFNQRKEKKPQSKSLSKSCLACFRFFSHFCSFIIHLPRCSPILRVLRRLFAKTPLVKEVTSQHSNPSSYANSDNHWVRQTGIELSGTPAGLATCRGARSPTLLLHFF